MVQQRIRRSLGQRQKQLWLIFVVLVVLIVSIGGLTRLGDNNQTAESKYAIARQSPFNHPDYYPLQQSLDSQLYRPLAPWLGRLILPTQPPTQKASDWVEFEVYNAPPEAQNLVGQVVRLEWSQSPDVQAYVQMVTQDVNFTPDAQKSQRSGNVHPTRLNHRPQVGPLQSLAGARPEDDVIVALKQVTVTSTSQESTVLRIAEEPVQVTGRFYGLVKVLKPVSNRRGGEDLGKPSPSLSQEFFRVRHYNPASQQFDGAEEVVRIPQVLPSPDGRYQSTPQQLEHSAAGKSGWYIYGAKNAEGVFVVQGIAPRSLFQLQPDRVLLGKAAGLNYINHQNWQQAKKGTITKVLVDPSKPQPQQAIAQWQEGDRALVVHLFGGIGGKKAEPNFGGTVTGHFAYGLAEVVRDPFTNELRFDIQYQQVYAHNPNAIIAGTVSWADYMGNLQRGWLGNRPVADVLVKLDAIAQDYNFGTVSLSPLRELQQQLNIMMARYRTGDGTGAAMVTPALSCVQDSSQAMYRTIKRIEQQVSTTPAIQSWLQSHPDHPQTLRFQQLVKLGKDLGKELIPLGIVRSDWQKNTEIAGIPAGDRFIRDNSWLTQLLSWRTVLPRVAHDEIISLFLRHGATLWFLRTNQVGGWNPDISPLAPTELFGQFYIIPNAFSRVIEAVSCVPHPQGWLLSAGMLLAYGLIALPLGWQQGFLKANFLTLKEMTPGQTFRFAFTSLISPALLEELVFRVLLIPHPTEGVDVQTWCFWAALSLLLFILYHPLSALTVYPPGYPTFLNPLFLLLTGLLGLVCTVVYALTGSVWAIALIHWVVVVVWLLGLGGQQMLNRNVSQQLLPKHEKK